MLLLVLLLGVCLTFSSASKSSGDFTIETDIDDSSAAVMENVLAYLVDLIGVNEDIIEQLTTDHTSMDAIITQEIESWNTQVNVANSLNTMNQKLYESYETQLNELSASSLSYDEELEDIEIEIERVSADLETANNNYLSYLVKADESKTELGELMSTLNEFLGIDSQEGTSKKSAVQLESESESTENLMNKMASSLNKIKSFSSFFDVEQSQQIEKISSSFLETSSNNQMNELYEVASGMLQDMEVTGSIWESYQVQMMEATSTYNEDLEDWNEYIESSLTTIADTSETISTMMNELETYMESSELIKGQASGILNMLEGFKTNQDSFYAAEFARLQDEIVLIQKIYDTFAAEISYYNKEN